MTEEKNINKTTTGLDQNLAAVLAYLFGWVGGIIFYLIEKENKFVRFAAMQSILYSISVSVAYFVLNFLLGVMSFGGSTAGYGLSFLHPVLWVGFTVVWVMLMYKAYNNEEWELPVIGKVARNTIK